MILGTGSNAAFLERADRVHHWEGERHGEKNVIIDIEWGAFGDKGKCCARFRVHTSALGDESDTNSHSPFHTLGSIDFIRTEHDKEVDNGSLLKRSFT